MIWLINKIQCVIIFIFLLCISYGTLHSQNIFINKDTIIHDIKQNSNDTITFEQYYDNKMYDSSRMITFFSIPPDSLFYKNSYYIGNIYIKSYSIKDPEDIIKYFYKIAFQYNANTIVDFYEPRRYFDKKRKEIYWICYGKIFYITDDEYCCYNFHDLKFKIIQ